MGDFASFSMGSGNEPASDLERQLRAAVERDRYNPVKHIGDVDARVSAADASKFSAAGFSNSWGAPIIGREIAMNDRYTDPASGFEMSVASALSLGLLQKG